MGLSKAKVYLKNGFKIIVFLDTGIEINLIRKKLIKDANLAIKQRPKLKLILYTNYSYLLFGLCKNVKIAIGGFKTRHLIFTIKVGDHDLVLDQFF